MVAVAAVLLVLAHMLVLNAVYMLVVPAPARMLLLRGLDDPAVVKLPAGLAVHVCTLESIHRLSGRAFEMCRSTRTVGLFKKMHTSLTAANVYTSFVVVCCSRINGMCTASEGVEVECKLVGGSSRAMLSLPAPPFRCNEPVLYSGEA